MRSPQAGGYTPAEQERQEPVRLETAERFTRGERRFPKSSALIPEVAVTD